MIPKLVFSRGGALFGVLASLAAVGLAIPATTAAATPTSLTSCGVIGMSGTYRLDRDVGTNFRDCFDITASNVTLILNGHTITGSPPTADIGIFVEGGAATATILGPGTVTGWDSLGAINLEGGNGSVRGVTATNSTQGIRIASAGNSIRGNVATNNAANGILATPGGTGNTIIGNSAHNNGVLDLHDDSTNCDSNVWRGNDFGSAFPSSCIH